MGRKAILAPSVGGRTATKPEPVKQEEQYALDPTPPPMPAPSFSDFCDDYIETHGDPGSGEKGLAIINEAWQAKGFPGEIKLGTMNIARKKAGATRTRGERTSTPLLTHQPAQSVSNLLANADLITEFFEFDEQQLDVIRSFFKVFTVADIEPLSKFVNAFKGK